MKQPEKGNRDRTVVNYERFSATNSRCIWDIQVLLRINGGLKLHFCEEKTLEVGYKFSFPRDRSVMFFSYPEKFLLTKKLFGKLWGNVDKENDDNNCQSCNLLLNIWNRKNGKCHWPKSQQQMSFLYYQMWRHSVWPARTSQSVKMLTLVPMTSFVDVCNCL